MSIATSAQRLQGGRACRTASYPGGMTETITIDLSETAPKAEVRLSGGRVLSLRRSPRATGGGCSWAARRPGWGDAGRAADELISMWTSPRIAPAEVGALGGGDRRRALLAVVRAAEAEADWRALYGTSLSTDERFVAVMRWSRERELREVRESLAASRRLLTRQVAGTSKAMSQTLLAATRPRDHELAKSAALLAGLGTAPRLAGIAADLTAHLGTAKFGVDLGRVARQAILPDLGTAYPLLTAAAGRPAGLAGFGAMPDPAGLGPVMAMSEKLKGLTVGPSYLESMKLNERSALRAAMEPLGIGQAGRLGSAAALAGQLGGSSSMRELIDATLASGRFDAGFDNGFGVASLGLDKGLGFEGLGFGRFGLELPKLEPWTGLGERFRETLDGLIVVEYARTWADDPMWFLLEFFSPTELPQLLGRREAVYQAVLDGLEVVVCESDLVPELAAVLTGLPFLTEIQRDWLRYGFDHARRREWTQAIANLFAGFEGALHSGAVAARRIDSGREGKLIGAEAIIKSFELSQDLEDFAIRLAFGGRGNAFRHGRPQDAARDQVLLVVVALIGWVDSVIGTDGIGTLVAELRGPLREAIEQDPTD
jgi:hypothetical protein